MTDGSVIDKALAQLNASSDGWESRLSGLNQVARAFHRRLLLRFAELGSPPNVEWIRNEALALELDPKQILKQLVESDLVVSSDEINITGAYPFSADQTPHRVEIQAGRILYAMCAIDALGIPFMLDRDAMILSHNVRSGEPVRVIVRGEHVHWDPPEALVFVGLNGGDGPIAQRCCTVINFFRSSQSAKAYQREADMEGLILTQRQAIDLSRRIFENLLREPVQE